MALILNIESSTEVCSVSISENGICKSLKLSIPDESSDMKAQHSKLLAVFIDEIIKENMISPSQIDAVAISSGPGSYTGLRIGTSTAKGFCFALNIPLIAVDTLETIASMAKKNIDFDVDYFVPMVDARRMEVYTKLFNNDLKEISKTEAKIIDSDSFRNFKDKKLLFCGNGSGKCEEVLNNKNFHFRNDFYPSAEYMGEYSEIKFRNKDFVDLVYFEPFYLKEFVATTPKNKML